MKTKLTQTENTNNFKSGMNGRSITPPASGLSYLDQHIMQRKQDESKGVVQRIGWMPLAGLAAAGSYAFDKTRKMVNDYRNKDTGYKVSLLTSGGIIGGLRNYYTILVNGMRTEDDKEIPRPIVSVLGSAQFITGHVSIRLDGPEDEVLTYGMGSNGVVAENVSSGGTRETHNITREQYEMIKTRMQKDAGKKIAHGFIDFPFMRMINKSLGKNMSEKFSCASWALDVLGEAGVHAGTMFDRWVLPIPKLIAQTGWDNTISGKLKEKEE